MISTIKTTLIDELKAQLDRVLIVGNAFDERQANRPQTALELRVLYDRSNWTKQTRQYRYTLTLTYKDLRQDDKAQDFLDLVCLCLLQSRLSLSIDEDRFVEYSDGLWIYEIDISILYPVGNMDEIKECLRSPVLNISGIQIYLNDLDENGAFLIKEIY